MKPTAITRSARGKSCTFSSDVCDSGPNNENVVFCHAHNGGIGAKAKDSKGQDIGFYGCNACHSLFDNMGANHPYYKPYFIKEMAEFAITRTKRLLVKQLLVDEYYTGQESPSPPRSPHD
tara:strand:- start:116 stop:475 length:360 start_codon:yes stop_codon:yes gene_type:complete